MYFDIIIKTSHIDTQNLWYENHINKTYFVSKLAQSTYRNIPYGEFGKLWYLTVTFKHNTPNEYNICVNNKTVYGAIHYYYYIIVNNFRSFKSKNN